MKMSRLDMFLIMVPMKFIECTVIKKKNEQLDVPMTTQEYIKSSGCWLYMSCWPQGAFSALVAIFDRVGLLINVGKTVIMVCHPCRAGAGNRT